MAVSIPNGMEFYFEKIAERKGISPFQFPTGWNSTKGNFTQAEGDSSFNSQRDGILRKDGI